MNERRNTPNTSALPFWRQLRWNLVVYAMLLAVVPMAIVVFITLSRTSAQAREQVVNQLESVAELKRDQIVRWLGEPDSAMNLILANPIRFTGGLHSEVGSAAVSDTLQEIIRSQSLFIELFLYDTNGGVVASSDTVQIGKVVSRQPYFDGSLVSGYVQ